MKKVLYTLVLCAVIAMTACNSDRKNNGATDSSTTDTSLTDSSKVVDSSAKGDTITDSAGVGSTPAPKP